jgi:iron complex outermembrane receptor protein
MMLPCTTVQRLDATRSFGSEALWAYEMGWRWNPLRSFSVDVAGYYNDYQNLRTLEPTASPVDATGFPVIYAPIVRFGNKLDGQTYGVEVTTSWSPVDRWKLIGNYSLFRANMDPDTDSVDPNSAGDVEKGSPTHQASLRSLVDLPYGLELDTGVYWVDNIRSGISRTPVSSYWTLNARLGWHVTENLELAVVGQNAQEAQHDEFGDGLFSSGTDVERSVFGQATFRY